jgi:hypothetical protein
VEKREKDDLAAAGLVKPIYSIRREVFAAWGRVTLVCKILPYRGIHREEARGTNTEKRHNKLRTSCILVSFPHCSATASVSYPAFIEEPPQ